MGNYEPTYRRPIADSFRKTADVAVRACLRLNIHPDTVSYASMVAATGAGLCFWQAGNLPWLLIPAALLCYLRLWFNMLDGMVAIASGKASRRGELLNELPDRVSDVLIFVGAAHSGLCCPFGGYAVAIFALLVAYVGMFGQALGVQREFSGLMSKPWRMVTLHIGTWIVLGVIWFGGGNIQCGRLTVLDWTFLIIIAGCVQTICVRLRRIISAMNKVEEENRPSSEPEQ
jgi:phosphatidylglycerophosphate synthase